MRNKTTHCSKEDGKGLETISDNISPMTIASSFVGSFCRSGQSFMNCTNNRVARLDPAMVCKVARENGGKCPNCTTPSLKRSQSERIIYGRYLFFSSTNRAILVSCMVSSSTTPFTLHCLAIKGSKRRTISDIASQSPRWAKENNSWILNS